MRKMYNTKRLLGSVACLTAALAAGPALTQAAEETPLFDNEAPATEAESPVNVGVTGEIDLHVKELEITKVLQLLSLQSERNIIASRGVENAKVSADLYGVSFDEALTSILEPNGFGYVEEGNFIYVLTKAEIEEQKQKNRKASTQIVRLDYLRADEAAAFVTPLLSENGTITASGNVGDSFDPNVTNAGANHYAGPDTLVIKDYEDNVQEITTILDELDLQPVNVIVEATVLRSTLTENNQFGVDFSLFTDLNTFTPLDIIDDVITAGTPDNQRFGAGQTSYGYDSESAVKVGFVAGDAAVFISALDKVTDATIVATPKVTVLDRSATKILVGEKIAYLSTTVTETSETQTVEFLEVGTQLNVRPFVSSDGKIRLELRPSVSDATIRTIGTTSAPDESTVELVTNVIVDSGQTVVLGGLITDDTSIQRSQFPGLGDIPILGRAFQGQNDTINRSEVIFLVKATVVGNDTLNRLGDEAMSRVDVARVAERRGTLPWSRSKRTAQYLVKARKCYDEAMGLSGESRDKMIAKAMFNVDVALHLNPTMIDALTLKEQISGKESYIRYEESIVKDTYDAVLDEELKALNIPDMPVDEPAAEAVEEAAEAGDLIEPEPLREAPAEQDQPAFDEQADADAFTEPFESQTTAETETEPETLGTEAQAEADEQWLEQVEAELLEDTDPQPETTEVAETQPAEETTEPESDPETTEVAENQPTEEPTEPEAEPQTTEVADNTPAEEPSQPQDQPEQPGVTEVPTNDAEPFTVGEADQARPQNSDIFGFSWRSLSTAQLLQLAAEATAQAQPENATADVPTDTD